MKVYAQTSVVRKYILSYSPNILFFKSFSTSIENIKDPGLCGYNPNVLVDFFVWTELYMVMKLINFWSPLSHMSRWTTDQL